MADPKCRFPTSYDVIASMPPSAIEPKDIASIDRDEQNLEQAGSIEGVVDEETRMKLGKSPEVSIRKVGSDERETVIPELYDIIGECWDNFRNGRDYALSGPKFPIVSDRDSWIYLRHLSLKGEDFSIEQRGGVTAICVLQHDVYLDDSLVCRIHTGLSHPDCGDTSVFNANILVLSNCGYGPIREDLTFAGSSKEPLGTCSMDVNDIFFMLQNFLFKTAKKFGWGWQEFLGCEVNNHKYFLSERMRYDVPFEVAARDYITQYGNGIREVLSAHLDEIADAAVERSKSEPDIKRVVGNMMNELGR